MCSNVAFENATEKLGQKIGKIGTATIFHKIYERLVI